VNRNARSNLAPHGTQIDLAQQSSAIIAESLGSDPSGAFFYFGVQFQGAKGAKGIARQIHAGTGIAPAGIAFNDVGRTAALPQCSGQRETCNARADNKYPTVLQIQGRSPFRGTVMRNRLNSLAQMLDYR
jgi:hypothetical protein